MFAYILFGAVFILSMVVQNSLKSKFAKYSKIPLAVPMAGRDIAAAMLQQNGCGNVQVTSVSREWSVDRPLQSRQQDGEPE
jgi:Zn-dependent membrane protease YugP